MSSLMSKISEAGQKVVDAVTGATHSKPEPSTASTLVNPNSSAAVLDFSNDIKSSNSSSARKPPIASKLESEGDEILEKRQSLTKEDINSKLEAAGEKRQEILDAKINTAKELEGHKKHETAQSIAK